MEFKELLENKFTNILSGVCLTLLREENKKITNKFTEINESNFFDLRQDFHKYMINYFLLRNYEIVSHDSEMISINQNGKKIDFFIDFDWSSGSDKLKLKILDRGLKFGITNCEIQNLIFISVSKKVFFLLNCENLKKEIKQNRDVFDVLTESDNLFKTKYVNFDPKFLNHKYKIFSLK